ncbi:MAG: hypothetical protein LBE35_05210 [Clostridiales bacterium]|jgi:hypothetical protein|nr:hypothetical protein [Clostridiales bacterium]
MLEKKAGLEEKLKAAIALKGEYSNNYQNAAVTDIEAKSKWTYEIWKQNSIIEELYSIIFALEYEE